jgi:DNA-binding XRE family transcriptional regulator|tara:strand:- start:116 stop:736 length:621 start_codon:yes stop_codon:yes gene_type:complete
MELDPKLAKKVLDADLANMAKRVNEGKNLTSNQRAYFLQATGQVPLPESGYAKSKVELAAILGVARQTIYKWGKLDEAPQPNSDGSHNIADWLGFIKLHNLKGAEDEGGMDLRDRKMLGQCLKIEAELEILKGEWVPKGLVKRFMEDVFVACRSKILQCQMDEQAKDEILNELTRLKEQDLGMERGNGGVDGDLSSVVSSAEVDGD